MKKSRFFILVSYILFKSFIMALMTLFLLKFILFLGQNCISFIFSLIVIVVFLSMKYHDLIKISDVIIEELD